MKAIIATAAASLLLASAGGAQPYQGDPNGGPDRDRYAAGGHHGHHPAMVLYSKDGFQGHDLYVDHPIRKLSHEDMDDKVSSIRIISGVWQVCKDDDFQGRCEIVDRSMPDMSPLNMDDKISSVRPVPSQGPGWQH